MADDSDFEEEGEEGHHHLDVEDDDDEKQQQLPSVSFECVGFKKKRASKTKKKSLYVAYVCRVKASVPGTQHSVAWTVHRRYSQFAALHKELSNIVGKDRLPGLPKKSLRRSFKPDYLEEKRVKLQLYVRALLDDPDVVRTECFSSFLVGQLTSLMPTLAVFTQIDALAERVEQERAAAAAAADECKALERQRTAATSQLSTQVAMAAQLRQERDALSEKVEALERRAHEREAAARRATAERDVATERVRELEEAAREAKRAIAALEARVEDLKSKNKVLKRAVLDERNHKQQKAASKAAAPAVVEVEKKKQKKEEKSDPREAEAAAAPDAAAEEGTAAAAGTAREEAILLEDDD